MWLKVGIHQWDADTTNVLSCGLDVNKPWQAIMVITVAYSLSEKRNLPFYGK